VIRGHQSRSADSQQLVEPEARSVAVLIVDDDEDARDVLAALIERAGYTTATAANGREALDRLRTIKPELILLDVCMPIMDGPTFRQEQRRHWDWLRIPTIVMTGANEEPMLDIAVEETLRKPVRSADVIALVARHCTKTRA
jgi:CheY-like chemotaxis protein